jgi:hypothetical protein
MKIFIASSSENKTVAKWIEETLVEIAKESMLDLRTEGWWDALTFSISTYESLVKLAEQCAAAIIVAGRDDLTMKREQLIFQPRDNVIFEMGLFAGKNGREETLLATVGNPGLPSDLMGIKVLELNHCDDEKAFKITNRSNIRQWINQVVRNQSSRTDISIQFPNLYKTINNIIGEIKQLKSQIDPKTVDILASNIFNQLTSSINDDNYIAGFLLNRIENELKDCKSIFATDVLGPYAWISPNAYKYLSIQIKHYIRRNTFDGELQLIVAEELAKSITDACERVKDLTKIGQSYSLFDNPKDFHWTTGVPKLQFARILLWSREELLSSIGESIISIHSAFNVPVFFLEVPEDDPRRDSDFIFFEKNDGSISGFFNMRETGFRPEELLKNGAIPGVGNCKKIFTDFLHHPDLMLAVDARHILKHGHKKSLKLKV